MAGMAIGYYGHPKILTNSDWQKKKGLIGKAKKTGVGALLDAAEAAHAKIDWAAIDPRTANPANGAALKKAIADAKGIYGKVIPPYEKALTAVANQVDKASNDVKKLPGSGSIIKALDAIKKAAVQQRVLLKSLDLDSAIKEVAERIERRQQLAKVHMQDSIKKFAAGAKAFLSDPQFDRWDSTIKQPGRSVSNSVKELEEYNAKFWKEFQKFDGFDKETIGFDKNDPNVGEEMSKLVKAAAAQVKAIAAFKP